VGSDNVCRPAESVLHAHGFALLGNSGSKCGGLLPFPQKSILRRMYPVSYTASFLEESAEILGNFHHERYWLRLNLRS
jgi:hypothetical protein